MHVFSFVETVKKVSCQAVLTVRTGGDKAIINCRVGQMLSADRLKIKSCKLLSQHEVKKVATNYTKRTPETSSIISLLP